MNFLKYSSWWTGGLRGTLTGAGLGAALGSFKGDDMFSGALRGAAAGLVGAKAAKHLGPRLLGPDKAHLYKFLWAPAGVGTYLASHKIFPQSKPKNIMPY